MRKSARLSLVTGFVLTFLLTGVALGPAASATARAVPTQLQAAGALAPHVRFTAPVDASLGAVGATAILPVTYNCTQTVDSPLLSQLLGSSRSLTLEVSQPVSHAALGGGIYITHGIRVVNNLICDGTDHTRNMGAIADAGGFRFVAGTAQALLVMQVCDLFGCGSSSGGGEITLS